MNVTKVERNDIGGGFAYYLWFMPKGTKVFDTVDFDDGAVAVDVTADGRVVGVELLSTGPDAIAALSEVERKYRIDVMRPLLDAAVLAAG